MVNKEQIWILGNEVGGADRCIKWDFKNASNFSDCDKLIVDMTTLTDTDLYFITWEKATEIFDQIKKRFESGGEIVCILQSKFEKTNSEKTIINNYFWCPLAFNFKKVTKGSKIEAVKDFEYNEYLAMVKNWEIEIENPKCKLYPTEDAFEGTLVSVTSSAIYTQSYAMIGGVFSVKGLLRPTSGKLVMLPPIEDSKEGINVILKSWERITSTLLPDWIRNITIPNLPQIKKLIVDENQKIEKIQNTILNLEKQKNELEKFRRLLYTDGVELEEIVMESLQKIGISSIRKGRDENHEDMIFDFESKDSNLCVIEVKGMERNMKLAHIRQTLHWALDYQEKGKKAKPLLIANIFRLEDLTTSKTKREGFSEFEEFCSQYDICVLPTTILFDLVCKVLNGKKISVKKLELLILETKGVLRDLTPVFGSD